MLERRRAGIPRMINPPVNSASSKPGTFFIALHLAAAAFLFFAVFAPMGSIPSDTEYGVETAKSLYFRKTLAIEKTPRFWSVNPTRQGAFHGRYGIGYAASFLPQVGLADLASRATAVPFEYALRFLLSFTNTVYAAAIALVFFLLLARLGYGLGASAVTVMLMCCASILLPYSKIVHAETPSSLCLLLFLYAIAAGKPLDAKQGLMLGAIAAALYLLKIGNGPLSLVVASYAAYCLFARRATAGGIAAFVLSAGLPLAGLMALNRHYYGSIFNFGYGEEQRMFDTPVLVGLAGLLLSPSKSVFVFSPLLALCAVSFPRFLKAHGTIAVFVAVILVTDVLFYARWHDWSGGWAWGPRLVVPAMIAGHVSLVEFVGGLAARPWKRAALAGFTAASLWICLLGSLVWYQQIYYFHKGYVTVAHSHVAIAARLFDHKLLGKPEVYDCADFCVDCTAPSYHVYWDDIVKGNTVDFTGFETYRGFSTMWTGLAETFGMEWAAAVPFLLLAGAGFFARNALRLCAAPGGPPSIRAARQNPRRCA
jgi:hypothetical protein